MRKEKMWTIFKRDSVDIAIVPCGLFLMFGYHLHLLYRILWKPETTVIGYENHNKMAWVTRILQGGIDEANLAVAVISSNISSSNILASLSIALSSLIGTWVGRTSELFTTTVIYGDTSLTTTSVKYISILTCFLVAFTSFIQSTRHYAHANFMLTTIDSNVPVSYVQTAVIRGANFSSVGQRALYFATTLMLWFFGPIPMFLCSVCMVIVLHILDSNSTDLHQYNFNCTYSKAGNIPEIASSNRMHRPSTSFP